MCFTFKLKKATTLGFLKQHLILLIIYYVSYSSGPDVPGEGEHKVMDMIRSFSEKVSLFALLAKMTVWLSVVVHVM